MKYCSGSPDSIAALLSKTHTYARVKIATPCLFAAALSATVLAASNSALAQNFFVEYENEKISIEANNIRIKELLLEIQNKTGIPVNFIADPKDTVSLTISDQTVESAIAKITENHMIIHDTINGKKSISELIIIAEDPALTSSAGGGSANLPTGQPAPAIEAPQPAEDQQPASEPNLQNPAQNPAPTDAPVTSTN